MSRYHQRIPRVNPRAPESWGKDDITGLPVMHNDMIKQYEYMGPQLQWTGMMVHFKDADQPNPQLMPPIVPPDPVPILNPRVLQFPQLPPIPTGLEATNITSSTITVEWDAVTFENFPITYVVQWNSSFVSGESAVLTATNYTISPLTPNNTYWISVASIAQLPLANPTYIIPNPQPTYNQSAFCNPIPILTTS